MLLNMEGFCVSAIVSLVLAQPVPAITGIRPAAAFIAVSINLTLSSNVKRLASPVVPVTIKESPNLLVMI